MTFRRMGARHVLTVTADKEGGITLDDLAGVSRALSDFLDGIAVEGSGDPLLQSPYDLEVVSPGLDRPLKTERDFARAVGDIVRMTFKKEGQSIATWTGKVVSAGSHGVEMLLKDGAVKVIALDQIISGQREIVVSGKSGPSTNAKIK